MGFIGRRTMVRTYVRGLLTSLGTTHELPETLNPSHELPSLP